MKHTWYILGAGAIGHLVAYKLGRAGLPVCLLQRNGHATQPVLKLVSLERSQTLKLALSSKPVTALKGGEITRLIVTTKANQACDAVASIAAELAPSATCLLLHNGMGIYERLSQHYARQSFALGTTTEAAYWQEDGALVYAGRGATHIGLPATTEPPAWSEELLRADTGFFWEADIEERLWTKLIVNCAINPLTALNQCSNGELHSDPKLRAKVRQVCNELALVSAARSDKTASSAAGIEKTVFSVIESTARNYSSMMRDVQRGRETEIDHITGFLLQEADRLGIPCPCNQALLLKIKQLAATLQRG